MVRVASAAASHVGLRREQNEDAYCHRPDLGLYVVADGMGGHAAGEVASGLAVQVIESFIERSRAAAPTDPDWPFPYDAAQTPAANRLAMAVRLCNRRIGEAAAADRGLRGMATTASAVLVDEESILTGHVGDSRIYLCHAGALRLVTRDHSWVGDQVRAGILSEEDARHHPWRNVVTRALDGAGDVTVDVAALKPARGDRLLICSDGLSGVVSDDEIAGLVSADTPLETICETLIARANAGGGPDNITVVLLSIDVD